MVALLQSSANISILKELLIAQETGLIILSTSETSPYFLIKAAKQQRDLLDLFPANPSGA